MMCKSVRYGFNAVLASSALMLFAAPAHAGEPEGEPEGDDGASCSDVDLGAHAGAECEVVASAECHAGCDAWVDATCEAKAAAECAASCEVGASAECTASCGASCSADCQLGIDLDLAAWCETQCVAGGTIACASAENAVACEADVHEQCAAKCDLDLSLDGLLGCSAGCEAACDASCEVGAKVECTAGCEADLHASCGAELGAQCHAECDANGAIVCDEAFVDVDDASVECIAALVGPDIDVPAAGDEAPLDAEADEDPAQSVGCAIDRGRTSLGVAIGLLALFGLTRRRRFTAA